MRKTSHKTSRCGPSGWLASKWNRYMRLLRFHQPTCVCVMSAIVKTNSTSCSTCNIILHQRIYQIYRWNPSIFLPFSIHFFLKRVLMPYLLLEHSHKLYVIGELGMHN